MPFFMRSGRIFGWPETSSASRILASFDRHWKVSARGRLPSRVTDWPGCVLPALADARASDTCRHRQLLERERRTTRRRQSAAEVATILKNLQYSATAVATALNAGFGFTVAEIAQALKTALYNSTQITLALKDALAPTGIPITARTWSIIACMS